MSEQPVPRRIDKPWGYELIWADNDLYVGKILHIDAGQALSLQYHEQKDETIFVLRGSIRFFAGRDVDALQEMMLPEGAGYRITPRTIHRMEAVADTDLLEASTPHLQDLVRLQDRYGRS